MDWAKDIFLNYDVDQFGLSALAIFISRFDRRLTISHGDTSGFREIFYKTRLTQAEAFLEHDPFNLDLIAMIDEGAFSLEVVATLTNDGSTSNHIVQPNRTPQEDRAFRAARAAQSLDLNLHRLHASPYDPNFW